MSVTVLWQAPAPQVGELVLDATLSESHTLDTRVTENPVEEGAAVTDHAQLQPRSVSLTGIVTNTPLDATAVADGTRYEKNQPGRGASAYAALRRLRQSRQLVALITPTELYENMMLVSLVVPREQGSGEAFRFSAQFREVILVQTQMVKLPASKKPRGQPAVNDGKKGAQEAPEATRRRSAAHNLLF
jgi:hypothetical protein